MSEPTPREKFQKLLEELFQFDLADLDFGIFRIMNYKRHVIARWIHEDLPPTLSFTYSGGHGWDTAQI